LVNSGNDFDNFSKSFTVNEPSFGFVDMKKEIKTKEAYPVLVAYLPSDYDDPNVFSAY
jgi:hypothetical protein